MEISRLRKHLPALILLICGFSLGVLAFASMGSSKPSEAQMGATDGKFFVPEAGYIEFLLSEVAKAEKSVLIYAPTVARKELIALLRDRFNEGVEVTFIMESEANPDKSDPRFLVGWLRANKIGQVFLSGEPIPDHLLVLDQQKMIALPRGLNDGQTSSEVLLTSRGTAIFDFFSSKVADSFTRSQKINF